MKTYPNLGSSASNDNNSRRSTSTTRAKFALRFIRSLKEMKKRGHVSNNSSADERSQRIKAAAYSSMAHAVGPRRAWARALLFKLQRSAKRHRVLTNMTRKMSRTCLILKQKKNKKKNKGINKKKRVTNGNDDVLLNQTDKLRGLVPGGKAMDVCSLFEETAHYIKCLATQVKVMQDIADQLSPK
ncbi:IBH1 transcription factor [Parasponia andersonii]|uniref:IBH1 transcription factor n=1 Tax=Parasponia andersonii TaxID=3476 RepID=A0A2P5AN86_PARAD|nr:IBH1 transcription factor [Parasponia andersonii]